MEQLSVIQGDTLDAIVMLEKPEDLVIESVYFKCPSQELNEELTLVEDAEVSDTEVDYGFTLSPEVTQSLRVGNFDFDIIVTLDSGEIYTVIRGNFEVIYRKNG